MKNFIFAITLFVALALTSNVAFADDNLVTDDKTLYKFEFQEPPVSNNSMYIVYYIQKKDDASVKNTVLQYLSITNRYTTDSDVYDWVDDVFFEVYMSSTKPTIYFNSSSTTASRAYSYMFYRSGATWSLGNFSDTFTTTTSKAYDFDTHGYKVIGYEIIGNNWVLQQGIGSKQTFTYLFSDEATFYNAIFDIISEIALNNELTADEIGLLEQMLIELNNIYHNTDNLEQALDYLCDYAYQNNIELGKLRSYLDLIYKNVNSIYNNTDEVEYYLDIIYNQLNTIYNKIDTVEEKLQQIINMFTPIEDESKYDDIDTSKQDHYMEVGKDLTSKDTTNQQQDLNIEVNNNAGGYIWNLFNNFISSNAKVIGMYITLLSCAFIALILGR